MKTKILLCTIMACFFLVGRSQTILVPQDYETIQEAINAASDNDIILVDTGIYYENISFNDKSIVIKSYFDPQQSDSSALYNTIIDGSMPPDTTMGSVVTFSQGLDTNAVLQGFTIQHGSGTYLSNSRYGGGILCHSGGKIVHNRIINNSAHHDFLAGGGGIYAKGSGSRPYFVMKYNLIKNNHIQNVDSYPGCASGGGVACKTLYCIIENNIIDSNYVAGRPYGCGLMLHLCDGVIANNKISCNTGIQQVGGTCRGAGIYIQDHDPGMEIRNNEIYNNEIYSGSTTGGGIDILTNGFCDYNEILIDGNIIRKNTVDKGGGLHLETVFKATVSNNVIQANTADISGGGIILNDEYGKKGFAGYAFESDVAKQKQSKSATSMPLLVNNTITGNHANNGGGIANYMGDDEAFVAFNNIICENTADNQGTEVYLSGNSPAYIYFNNVDPVGIEGAGILYEENNFQGDPCFWPDLIHIEDYSCCVNTGTTELLLNDTLYSCPDHDIDGESRPNAGQPDVGADEYFEDTQVQEMDEEALLDVIIYPNPFTEHAILKFRLLESTTMTIKVFDIAGKKVQEVNQGALLPGEYEYLINMEGLPSGIYIVSMRAGKHAKTVRVIKY